MKFLAAAIILFIGVSGDLAIASAATSASAAAPASHTVAVTNAHISVVHVNKRHANPYILAHRAVRGV
jgi:hypothetical protein